MLNPAMEDNADASVAEKTAEPQSASRPRVLIVDDDKVTRELLRGILEKQAYDVLVAASGEQALELLKTQTFAILLTDVHMFDLGGLGLLSYLNKTGSSSVVILMTGYGSLEGAIQAIHEGAFDYISKPLRAEELVGLVGRAVRHWETRRTEGPPLAAVPAPGLQRSLIGKSPRIVQVYKTVAKATMSTSNILVVGASGTGKELIAKAIHENSRRAAKNFVTVNCGALTETLLESELFGHVKGSFTGAISNKRGLFDEADGGTIFLDEIGDITPALQVKLLRVIQEGEFKPVGSTEIRKVDARLIAATHRDLETYVREGRFREDLYYRLKVILIELPSLKERIEDLPELAYHFLALFSSRSGKKVSRISREAMQLLHAYPWPGNIRELEHAIERAVAMTSTAVLYSEDFPAEIVNYRLAEIRPVPAPEAVEGSTTPQSLEQVERQHIVRVLREVNFNKSKAADILGIDRATLYRKAHRYSIRLAEEK